MSKETVQERIDTLNKMQAIKDTIVIFNSEVVIAELEIQSLQKEIDALIAHEHLDDLKNAMGERIILENKLQGEEL